jgi:hypothetical protein
MNIPIDGLFCPYITIIYQKIYRDMPTGRCIPFSKRFIPPASPSYNGISPLMYIILYILDEIIWVVGYIWIIFSTYDSWDAHPSRVPQMQ